MTLVEVLAALAIGLVVLFAVFGLMSTMVRSSAESRGRTEAVREGRITVDRVGQELRLASCPDTGSALLAAGADSVSFYVARPQADFRLSPVVERHTLTFAGGRMTLQVSPGTGTPPTWAAPTRTITLGTGLAAVGATPVFQYLAYDSPERPDTSLVTAPVAADRLRDISQVRVTLNARPTYGDPVKSGSRFDSTIVLRTDDPTDQDNTPQC